MGLTIHYKLSVAKNLPTAVVRELAQRTAHYAQKIGCAEVGEVRRVEADTPFTALFVRVGREKEKDASADDSGLSVVAPIFDYVHFERLEHEGRREFGGQIAQLQKEVRKRLF